MIVHSQHVPSLYIVDNRCSAQINTTAVLNIFDLTSPHSSNEISLAKIRRGIVITEYASPEGVR